jgi:hypothetical protein
MHPFSLVEKKYLTTIILERNNERLHVLMHAPRSPPKSSLKGEDRRKQ